ncbi:UPF0481 protein At3g47200-like [Carex rostrata]
MDPVIDIEMTSAAEGPENEEMKVRPYWSHDSNSSSDSIFRAPTHIKYGRETEFEPKLVSIGPYHRDRPILQSMKDKKVRCMSDLVKRSAGGGSNIDRVVPVGPFMQFEKRARSFYKKKFNKIRGAEFVNMLVLDSCFIIRIMLSFFGMKSTGFLEVNMKDVRSDLLLPRDARQAETNWADHRGVTKLMVNATELHQTAGITFQKTKKENTGLQVEFSKGIMRMHCLKIDPTMATLLVNLIAFENFMPPSIRIISTYMKLMNDLIDTEKDVELLQKFDIIYNTMSNHSAAATFFNEIGDLGLINYKENNFSDLFLNVDKYYKSSWNRRWANLQHNYCNSPWAVISVFAAVILLILTVLQTFYTIDGYYSPRTK